MARAQKKREVSPIVKPNEGLPSLPKLQPPNVDDILDRIENELEFGGDGGDECLCF